MVDAELGKRKREDEDENWEVKRVKTEEVSK